MLKGDLFSIHMVSLGPGEYTLCSDHCWLDLEQLLGMRGLE